MPGVVGRQAAVLPEGTEVPSCSACSKWAIGLSSEASLDGLPHVYAALALAWWWMLDYLPATGAAGITTLRTCDDYSPCAVTVLYKPYT